VVRKSIIVPNYTIKDTSIPENYEASIFLDLFNMCQSIPCLPKAGGLLDQDGLYVDLMRHAIICQDQRRQMDKGKAEMNSGGG